MTVKKSRRITKFLAAGALAAAAVVASTTPAAANASQSAPAPVAASELTPQRLGDGPPAPDANVAMNMPEITIKNDTKSWIRVAVTQLGPDTIHRVEAGDSFTFNGFDNETQESGINSARAYIYTPHGTQYVKASNAGFWNVKKFELSGLPGGNYFDHRMSQGQMLETWDSGMYYNLHRAVDDNRSFGPVDFERYTLTISGDYGR